MTSRDRASSEPSGDAPDEAEGVAGEDGDGDEPDLRAMRAVWRGMRDASDETAGAACEGDAAGGSEALQLRMLRAAPGGKRDASGADRDAALDGELEGGDGDAPGLRAMRAVWLTMRDEAPPDRGLAELLAAARHKAEAMQPRPTLWQRMAAALRRPPVFALAAAVVLIGGAVVIGRRAVDEMPRAHPSDAGGPTGAGSPAAPPAAAPGDVSASDSWAELPGSGSAAGLTAHHGLAVPAERARMDAEGSEAAMTGSSAHGVVAPARPELAGEKVPGGSQLAELAGEEVRAVPRLHEPVGRDREPGKPTLADLRSAPAAVRPSSEVMPPGPVAAERAAAAEERSARETQLTTEPEAKRPVVPGGLAPPWTRRSQAPGPAEAGDVQPAEPRATDSRGVRVDDDLEGANESSPAGAEAPRVEQAGVRRGSAPVAVRRGAGAPDTTKGAAAAPSTAGAPRSEQGGDHRDSTTSRSAGTAGASRNDATAASKPDPLVAVGASKNDAAVASSGEVQQAEWANGRRGSPPSTSGGAGPVGASKNDAAPSKPERPVLSAHGAGEAAPPQQQTSLAQLVERCESAAKRGDCAAVRRMVGQISKSDRGYRGRVAKGSAVAKCLVE